jgi:hypothetical protein
MIMLDWERTAIYSEILSAENSLHLLSRRAYDEKTVET